MIETTGLPRASEPRPAGLMSRMAGVIFSPGSAYAHVVARPRALGALVVTIVVGVACQMTLLSTDVGKEALLERQVTVMEGFGVNVTDEMYRRMEARLPTAPYTTAATQVVFAPLIAAVLAGLFLGVFNALLDGTATFRQLFAVVAHAGAIPALQQIFSTPINYARGELASPSTLAVFLPMLDPDGFVAGFLGTIDLFFIWWIISLAIGLGVLYKRRTGPIATSLLCIYAVIALVVAVVF